MTTDADGDDFPGAECVGIACTTISVNQTLRLEVASLLERHAAPVDAILLEGWVAGLSRRMADGGLSSVLDDAAMVVGATRVFSDDNWAEMASWLQLELHGRTSTG